MPIIHLCDATDEGAVGHDHGHPPCRYINGKYEYIEGPNAYWTRTSHHGLCLHEREANGYNDSDFFMTVWNEEKGEPEEIMFATTRGWTYPCLGSSVDATPEVRAKYEAWQARKAAEYRVADRKRKATIKRDLHRTLLAITREHNVPIRSLHRLRKAVRTVDGFAPYIKLLTGKLRSDFRKSLRKQVVEWLRETNPKYDFPLSPRQRDYLR